MFLSYSHCIELAKLLASGHTAVMASGWAISFLIGIGLYFVGYYLGQMGSRAVQSMETATQGLKRNLRLMVDMGVSTAVATSEVKLC
jgi:hypothetical protein